MSTVNALSYEPVQRPVFWQPSPQPCECVQEEVVSLRAENCKLKHDYAALRKEQNTGVLQVGHVLFNVVLVLPAM